MPAMTALEVADRLGVKVATVYAYVSRGALRSWREPGSRQSRFDAREVEALARRGRPRRASRPPALDFVIETALTTIGDHHVFYRGRSAFDLARGAAFEEVAHWLWTGDATAPPLPWSGVPVALPDLTSTRDRIRMAVVSASAADPLRSDLALPAVVERARALIATMAAAAPATGEGRSARLVLPGREAPLRGTVAGQLWAGLARTRPTPGLVAALNAALVLVADHELAASTLAARVAASARADPYAVVLTGLGALSGSLHGGATERAYELLESAAASGPEPALARALETSGYLPGFGQPLYPAGDPRGRLLLELLGAASPGHPALGLAERLVATARVRARVEPNLDFALAVLARVARMPADGGETVFTVARSAGWIAHAIEEYGEAPMRFRARAVARRPGPADSWNPWRR